MSEEAPIEMLDAIRSGDRKGLCEAIEWAEEIDSEPWRWGSRVTYVIPIAGKFYRFTVDYHAEDGIQGLRSGPEEVRQVERTVTVWEPVP